MKVKGVDSVFPDKNSSTPEKKKDNSVGFEFTYSKEEKFKRISKYFSKSVRTGIHSYFNRDYDRTYFKPTKLLVR